MINSINITSVRTEYESGRPFNHVVIDDFWSAQVAAQLAEDISHLPLQDKGMFTYDNAIEKKIVCNHYDRFPKTTYQAFLYLNSSEFLKIVTQVTRVDNILTDIGLHGGGVHIHPTGGKLNVHKDYSIHPKLGKERKLNLIVYMTPDWQAQWGGDLELWSHDDGKDRPLELAKRVPIKFNRAVLFDTTQNSWHGLPHELKTPKHIKRQSMAVYYLTEPRQGISARERALFVPTKQQANDPQVLELIEKRSGSKTSADVL